MFVHNSYQQRTKVCLQWLSEEDKSLFAMIISSGQKFAYNGYQKRTKGLQWLSAEDKSLFAMVINRGQMFVYNGYKQRTKVCLQ